MTYELYVFLVPFKWVELNGDDPLHPTHVLVQTPSVGTHHVSVAETCFNFCVLF